jgi:hypothetical protein
MDNKMAIVELGTIVSDTTDKGFKYMVDMEPLQPFFEPEQKAYGVDASVFDQAWQPRWEDEEDDYADFFAPLPKRGKFES